MIIQCDTCGRWVSSDFYTRVIDGDLTWETHWMCPCGAHGMRTITTVKVTGTIL